MNAFFVTPFLPRFVGHAGHRHDALSPRRRPTRTPHRMSAGNPPAHGGGSSGADGNTNRDDGSNSGWYPGDGDVPFARFREFTSSTGDASLQDNLVREVMWQATRTVTTQNMESTIQMEIDAVSDLLSDMYTRSERQIVQRNEELARQTSLPNISKWNQELIKGHKASKIRRSEISKELEIVDALLRRRTRRSRNRRTKRTQRAAGGASDARSLLVTDKSTDAALAAPALLQDVLQIKGPKALVFSIAVCVLALESFENIASQENGPSNLAHFAAITSLFLLSCAYLHTLHSTYRNASQDLQRVGKFVNKDRSE